MMSDIKMHHNYLHHDEFLPFCSMQAQDSTVNPSQDCNGENDERQLNYTPSEQRRTKQISQQPQSTSMKMTTMDAIESVVRFLSLPSQVAVVICLEFLNSFRSFGLRFVLYNYITDEFGIGDTHAGTLLGIKSFVDIGFGLVGSILVDIVGVRTVSISALSVAIIGRMLLAFGRTKSKLYLALFLFSPCGDALLSVGLYRVALKKLTTPRTRPLAFGVSYAVQNLAGAFVSIAVDQMRTGAEDIELYGRYFWAAGVYTPIRQFIILTWVVVLVTCVIAYFFLEDWTVIDPDDLDDSGQFKNDTEETNLKSAEISDNIRPESGRYHRMGTNDCYLTIPPDAIPAEPIIKLEHLRKLFPNHFQSLHSCGGEIYEQQIRGFFDGSKIRRLPRYMIFKTRSANAGVAVEENHRNGTLNVIHRQQYSSFTLCFKSLCRGALQIVTQALAILRLRNTWKVFIFSFVSVNVALQWTASEIALPPFLERRFGESIPIYKIQTIHLVGSLILPPIVGAISSEIEDFQIIMPGLWIMATSPVFLAMFPNVLGACAWQTFMTLGQVLWSPRQDSWTATLAPTGMEGLFFAVGSSRAMMAPIGDLAIGIMNEKYNTNCPECRDQYGHFCQWVSAENEHFQCVSIEEKCNLFLNEDVRQQQTCPKTCLECPTWKPTDPSTFWYILVLTSIISPLSAWFFLPFLRGEYYREDECYGIVSLRNNRFLGFCGAPDRAWEKVNDVDRKVATYGTVSSVHEAKQEIM